MIFRALSLAGVYLIEPERREDNRGFFARVFDEAEFKRRQLHTHYPEHSISFNQTTGTLRGMHYQAAPHEEIKLVRCTMGAIYDVILDLRPGSATFKRWEAVELSAENRLTLYIPAGLAHGFQTLEDRAEVAYQISSPYVPSAARGVRWDDPAFDITWPQTERIISDRDRSWPLSKD